MVSSLDLQIEKLILERNEFEAKSIKSETRVKELEEVLNECYLSANAGAFKDNLKEVLTKNKGG